MHWTLIYGRIDNIFLFLFKIWLMNLIKCLTDMLILGTIITRIFLKILINLMISLLNTESDKRSFFTSLRFGSICGHIICVFDLERNSFDEFFSCPNWQIPFNFSHIPWGRSNSIYIRTVSAKRRLSALLIQFILEVCSG